MAAMTTAQQVKSRRIAEKNPTVSGINYNKTQFNAAVQACIDRVNLAATQTAISNDINTATSPLVLTANQKRLAFCIAMLIVFEQEGIFN